MTIPLYLDITAGTVVRSPAALATYAPKFFFGDTLSLSLAFLQETGVIGAPLAGVSLSGSTLELAIGTVGGGAAVTATSWADAASPTISVSSTVTGTSSVNAQQTLSFSTAPTAGGISLTLPARSGSFSTGASPTFFTTSANHGLVSGSQITLSWTGGGDSYTVLATPSATTFTVTSDGTTAVTPPDSVSGTYAIPAATTALIALPASASTIQTALSALPTIGSGNVVVSGSGTRFSIIFVNALGFTPVPTLTALGSASGYPAKTATLALTGTTLHNLVTSQTPLVLEVSVTGGTKVTLVQTPVTVSPALFTS